jgi:hypothetical protein
VGALLRLLYALGTCEAPADGAIDDEERGRGALRTDLFPREGIVFGGR